MHADAPLEIVMADHMFPLDRGTVAIIFRCLATGWTKVYPVEGKSPQLVTVSLRDFIGHHKCRLVISDEADEISVGASAAGLPHWSFTPHRPQQNGIIERTVGLVKTIASCALHRSRLPPKIFWRWAHRYAGLSLSCFHPTAEGHIPIVELTGAEAIQVEIPFGCLVWCRDHEPLAGGSRLYPALFLSWVTGPGGLPNRDIIVIRLANVLRAILNRSFRGLSHVRRSREYLRPVAPQFPVGDFLDLRRTVASFDEEVVVEDTAVEDGEQQEEMRDAPPETGSDVILRDPEPQDPAPRDAARGAYHEWIRAPLPEAPPEGQGCVNRRVDFPDGPMYRVNVPRGSRRPPWVNSYMWATLHRDLRVLEQQRWREWSTEGITNGEACERFRIRGVARPPPDLVVP